jgi:hypothetical protein
MRSKPAWRSLDLLRRSAEADLEERAFRPQLALSLDGVARGQTSK